jgi:SWI/SNF-related matrix-associated actin-dependent regulator of chromatin subfamily A-like protein 1
MQIVDHGTHFFVRMDYNQFFKRNLEGVKNIPGHRWFAEKKAWWLPSICRNQVLDLVKSHKALYVDYANATAEEVGEVEPLPELTVIPPIRNIELRPYQRNGIAQSMRLKRLINGDEMGLGKTVQSIVSLVTAAQEGNDVFPALVICPASLKENWKREIEKFTTHKAMILSDKNRNSWPNYFKCGYATFFITNYESLKKYFITSVPTKKRYKSIEIGVSPNVDLLKAIIIDESHRCKDTSTQQTKFALRIANKKEWVILLTGTPVVNKPIDLWPQLCIMGHTQIFGPTEKEYKNRFCDGGYGASNLKALNYLLQKHCFFRREKKDVAKDLPTLDRQKMVCEISTRQEYDHANTKFLHWLHSQDFTAEKIASALKAEMLVQMNVLRQISARGKIEQAKEFIDEVLNANEKIIVFCNLKAIVNELKAIYPKATTITGSDSSEQRDRNVVDFQTKPEHQLIIINMKAGGVGLTLTASSRVLFIEFPWTYADCVQCEARSHRIGQTLPVMCTYLLGEDTIDEKMLDIILSKKDLAQAVTGSSDQMEMKTIDAMINLFNVKKEVKTHE